MSNSMEKPKMDPVKEAIAKIPELRRRAEEIRTNEPPAQITDVAPAPVVITERMRKDARAREAADRKMLGENY